jgi:hypothetical protein
MVNMAVDSICAVERIVICELLCYVQNNFSKCSMQGLATAISGFYAAEEIEVAKCKLFETAKDVFTAPSDGRVAEALPRQQVRRGESKRKLDTDDLLKLYGVLDRANSDLPVFVAANLSRIPPFSPDATDFCSLASSVEFLSGQMCDVMKRLDLLGTKRMDVSLPERVLSSAVDACCGRSTSIVGSINDGLQSHLWSSSSTSSTVEQPAAAGPSKSYSSAVAATLQPVRQLVRVHGSRQPVVASMGNTAPSSLVRAVPRRPTAFVGRLHIDTTADDLTQFLQEAGLQGVNCRKLTASKDRTFRCAAFQVSCADVSRDLFYCDNTWPEGAELRDWYFKPKSSARDTQVKILDRDGAD